MADLRKCIGSARFGIEPHEAPVEDFPKQPSQKDGLGRMCKQHWNAYTTALRNAAMTAKAEDAAAERVRTQAPRAGREAPEQQAETSDAATA